MQCPVCQAENPPTNASCTKCSTPLPVNDQTLGAAVSDGTLPAEAAPHGTSAWSIAVTPPPGAPYPQGEELVGIILAERYEILELLGQGGMGAVYKARDTELERLVALKLIRADLASNPEILRRFKQELILAREVTHRNVIRIFDLGQAKGFKFITMEFVEGRDLRAVLRERGKLPPDETVRVIAQICRALESAHAAGVVHRDLKPQKDRKSVVSSDLSRRAPGKRKPSAGRDGTGYRPDLPRTGICPRCRCRSSRPETSKHHAGRERPRLRDGLWHCAFPRNTGHDTDGRIDGHAGIYVARAGQGHQGRRALRSVCSGHNFL